MNVCAKQGPFLRFYLGPLATPQWTFRSQECCAKIGPFCDSVQPVDAYLPGIGQISYTETQKAVAARGKV
jgi:hypothetical protein